MGDLKEGKIPQVHFDNLDALRFLAAFSVLVFHFFADMKGHYPSFKNNWLFNKLQMIADKGSLGVNFFFVLSGFLITYLILHEHKHRGYFSVKNFLLRRTLRIWPLYFIVVLIGFVLFPLLIDGYFTTHDPIMYITFLANFDEIKHGLHDPINFLTAPWSVAVEEQFYLFWGLALFILFRIHSFKLIHLIVLLSVGSIVFRWYYVSDERIIYYHTLSVCQDILTGSFIGLSLFEGRKWMDKLSKLSTIYVILIYAAGIGICLAKNKLFAGNLLIFERFVLSLFFAFIILDQIRGNRSFFKLGKIKLFNYLGKISYGLYMYHLIVMYLLLDLLTNSSMDPRIICLSYFCLCVAGTTFIASMSYYLIERPLLKLKPH